MNLIATEIRVLGCLLEKQRTTPDAYPLSLNALRLACNQSTNREPVVAYDDAAIRDALERLHRRGYARLASGAGSRTAKYRHLLAEALPMADDEQAVMCVLMLRGPQTPGELKQRAERMHVFTDLGGVQETLARLIERELVRSLGRRPGQKEERYAQLLEDPEAHAAAPITPSVTQAGTSSTPSVTHGGTSSTASAPPAGDFSRPAAAEPASDAGALAERVSRLEQQVAELLASRAAGSQPAAQGQAESTSGITAGEFGLPVREPNLPASESRLPASETSRPASEPSRAAREPAAPGPQWEVGSS